MPRSIRVAVIQMEPTLADVAADLGCCLESLSTAAKAGAELVVFPEAAPTGYLFRDLSEAIPATETIPGPSTEAIAHVCRLGNLNAVAGLLEAE